MKHNCFQKQYPTPKYEYKEYEALSSENVADENGRMITRSIYVIDSPANRDTGKKVSDFCLENALATGQDLKECKLNTSDFIAATNVQRSFAQIESARLNFNESKEPKSDE